MRQGHIYQYVHNGDFQITWQNVLSGEITYTGNPPKNPAELPPTISQYNRSESTIANTRAFTSLDAKRAFHQIQMDSTSESEDSKKEPEPPTSKNKSESGSTTPKGALSQTIISLLSSLGIAVPRTGQALRDLYNHSSSEEESDGEQQFERVDSLRSAKNATIATSSREITSSMNQLLYVPVQLGNFKTRTLIDFRCMQNFMSPGLAKKANITLIDIPNEYGVTIINGIRV